MFISSLCLPYGKADDTPSPLLSRARSRRRRFIPLYQRGCALDSARSETKIPLSGGYGASSTFAHLRFTFFWTSAIILWSHRIHFLFEDGWGIFILQNL